MPCHIIYTCMAFLQCGFLCDFSETVHKQMSCRIIHICMASLQHGFYFAISVYYSTALLLLRVFWHCDTEHSYKQVLWTSFRKSIAALLLLMMLDLQGAIL